MRMSHCLEKGIIRRERCSEGHDPEPYDATARSHCNGTSGIVANSALQTEEGRGDLEVVWEYTGAKSFSWEYDAASETAKIRADFGRGEISYPLQLKTFATEETLAEAIFC